ncbi:Molybdopterin cofactor biosynthesis C domain-containing protein, partial [Tirmania nivea]
LTHLTPTGQAHMVPITRKPTTPRLATATCIVYFSTPETHTLIHTSQLKKGDALSVARLAGISAAKLTPQLVPLCHNILIEGVHVELTLFPPTAAAAGAHGGVYISATVNCEGKTGVEMEALVAATVAGLNVYDMCKSVDRGMVIDQVRVVEKQGGRSGGWVLGSAGKLVNVNEGE